MFLYNALDVNETMKKSQIKKQKKKEINKNDTKKNIIKRGSLRGTRAVIIIWQGAPVSAVIQPYITVYHKSKMQMCLSIPRDI